MIRNNINARPDRSERFFSRTNMNQTANTCQPATFDGPTIARIAALLGVASHAPLEVTVEVVNITEGLIGGEDVSIVPAILDLTTGKLALVDKELGYPPLIWDEIGATIHHGGNQLHIPVTEDNVPNHLWRAEISDHIRTHGYWAMLDLRSLLHMGS